MKKVVGMFLVMNVVLSSVVLGADKKPAVKVVPSTPALLAKGKAAFAINCAACHGDNLDGNSPAAAALNPKPRNFKVDAFKGGEDAASVFTTITGGLMVDGKPTTMVAFGHLPVEDRWGLVHYVLSVRPKKAKK